MTETSFPWYSTVTGDAGGYSDDTFASFVEALIGDRSGVSTGLSVGESSPQARSVTVQPGKAIIKGRTYILDAETVLAIAENSSGNPRIDRAILRVDYAAQTIRAAILTGVAAASPSAPALTQVTDTLWEESLAQIAVASGASTITDANITPERSYLSVVPVGAVIPFGGAESMVPDGWLLCYGQAVSRVTYRDLFECIGTAHGVGDESTTFNVPDMRGSAPVGLDNMGGTSADVVTATEADTLGDFYGEMAHALTAAENGAHSHNMQTLQVNSNIDDVQDINIIHPGTSGSSPTSTSGSGTAHNNMQPSLFLNFIIKA